MLPQALPVAFLRERLDRGHAAHRLDEQRVLTRRCGDHIDILQPDRVEEGEADRPIDRQCGQRHEGQQRGIDEHQRQRQ